jgi:hexosaminidase
MFRHTILPIVAISAFAARMHAQSEATASYSDPAANLPVIAAVSDSADVHLIPWPMRGQISKERVKLSPSSRIVASTPELEKLGALLSDQVVKVAGRKLPVAKGAPKDGDIVLRITPGLKFENDPYLEIDKNLVGLENRIQASGKGVQIEGMSYQATALATATFLQSLDGRGENVSFPMMKIEDKPASVFTGVMLDVARQFHPIGVLKEVVDMCQFYRIPYFHLHFSDDQGYRLPSKAFPQLPSEGASYTEAEIRDFVAYADERGVTIIPEVEMPGHSSALQKALPEIFGAKNESTGAYETLGVLNIANEEIYPALEKIIAENCELFKSSPYFHIGADETNFGQFFNNPTVQKQIAALEAKKVTTQDQLFSYFINRINGIVKKHGRKTICWEGFAPSQNVDKDVIIFAWHGQSYAPQTFLENGYTVVNVPWTPSIYDSQKANYEWNKWSMNLNEHRQSRQFEITPNILGGLMVFWEKGPNEAMPMLRPKTPARQERIYSPFAGRSFIDFAKRYQHTDAVLERLVYPVDVKIDGLINQEENLFQEPVKVTLSTPVEGAKIRYTINQSDVSATNSTLYQGTFELNPSQATEVYVTGYYGPRIDLRVRIFDKDDRPIGGTKLVELRPEVPRVEYVIKEIAEGVTQAPSDTKSLKVLSKGVLGRLESSVQLATDDGPRLFEAKSTIEVRTAGAYELQIRAVNGPSRYTKVKIGDQWYEQTTAEPVKIQLPVGVMPVEVQQVADDGQIGTVVCFINHALQDPPGPEARRFTNESIYQWMLPLNQAAAKK